MRTYSQVLFLLLFQFPIYFTAFAQCTGWAKTASGEKENSAWGITLDEQKNSYVAGFYNGPTTFGNLTVNDSGLFVIKNDSLGNQLWVKTFPGSFYEIFSFINYTAEGVYLATTFDSSATFGSTILTTSGNYGIAAVKLNTAGNVQWAETFSCTGYSYTYGIRNTASGKVLITGRYNGTLTMGSYTLPAPVSGYCIYLAELDETNGEVIWATSSKVQDDFNNGRGYAIRTDLLGNIILSGYYANILKFENVSLDNSDNPFSYAPFVAKFDSNGTCLWIQGGIGPVSFNNVYGLTTDSLNNVYFSCPLDSTLSFSGQIFDPENGNFVIGKYDESGDLIWAKQWGSHIKDSISLAIALHINQNSTLTAYGWGVNEMIFDQDTLKSAGSSDIFAADFDLNGNYLSSFITGNINTENFYDAAFDDQDHAYVAGYFFGDTTTLGNFGLHGDAVTDTLQHSNIFVWKNCEGIATFLQPVDEKQPTIFPNPSDGLFYISGINQPTSATFLILDISGRMVMQGKIQDHKAIDLSGFPSGIYLLKISEENISFQFKFLRQ